MIAGWRVDRVTIQASDCLHPVRLGTVSLQGVTPTLEASQSWSVQDAETNRWL